MKKYYCQQQEKWRLLAGITLMALGFMGRRQLLTPFDQSELESKETLLQDPENKNRIGQH